MLNYNVKGNKKERIKYNNLKNIWLNLYREEQFWLIIYLKCQKMILSSFHITVSHIYHVISPQSGNS